MKNIKKILLLNYPLIFIIIGAESIGHSLGNYRVNDWVELVIGALLVGIWIGDYWKD